jgi:hypothetical protein
VAVIFKETIIIPEIKHQEFTWAMTRELLENYWAFSKMDIINQNIDFSQRDFSADITIDYSGNWILIKKTSPLISWLLLQGIEPSHQFGDRSERSYVAKNDIDNK